MRVAVIGTGIAGSAAAWALSKRYPVTVYERELRPGGHSHTVTVDYTAVGPSVTGVSPATGPLKGGNTVKITGTDFTQGATVDFGSNASSKVTYVSHSELKAVVPAGSAGRWLADRAGRQSKGSCGAEGLPVGFPVLRPGRKKGWYAIRTTEHL